MDPGSWYLRRRRTESLSTRFSGRVLRMGIHRPSRPLLDTEGTKPSDAQAGTSTSGSGNDGRPGRGSRVDRSVGALG